MTRTHERLARSKEKYWGRDWDIDRMLAAANRNDAETAIRDNHQIVVDQYILSEVFTGLDRSRLLSGPETNAAKDDILGLWREAPGIKNLWESPRIMSPE